MTLFKTPLLQPAAVKAALQKDSLLAIANVLILLLRIGLVIGMAGTGFMLILNILGLGAQLFGIAVKLPPGSSVTLSLQIILYLGLGLAGLSLINSFFMHLTRIIGTVSLATPFVPENADRLMRMGWLTLWAQLLTLPLGLVSHLIGPAFAHPAFEGLRSFSLGGLILSLTLFVLARVFRMGTQLSDEIEGTV